LGKLDLNFEPGDLAGVVWVAIAVLGLAETVRYLRAGRRPGSAGARAGLVGLAAVLLGSLIISGRLNIRHISHAWACFFLALLVLPWMVRSYSTTTRPIHPLTRFTLRSLRIAAVLVALLMLARPVLLWTTSHRERAVVGILLDTSQSMNVRDVGGAGAAEPMSRLEAVRHIMAVHSRNLDRLAGKMDVEWMSFDARLRRVDGPPAKAEGGLTALGRGVDSARDALIQTGSRIAGLILISDGRDTSVGAHDLLQSADELTVAGIPLYTIGVGSELPSGQTRSIAARRLDMIDRVSVLNRLDVGAEFLAAGLGGSDIDMRLEYDGKTVDSQTIMPTQVRELIRADLSHVPTEGGLHQVTVVASVRDLAGPQGEARLSRYVRVTDDKVQVLYIDRARYERAGVARALEYAGELNVTKIDLNAPPGAPAAGLLPSAADAWRAYHVVIIGDVAREQMPDAAMSAIANLVTAAGRGAAILGGTRTLGSGAYAGAPFDALFPVDLRTQGQSEGAVPFEIAPAGRLHPCCMMTAEMGGTATAPAGDVWSQMPPFAGASLLGRLDPATEVLIRAESGEPLMVVQQKGAGRTAAIAFDSSWQWPFAGDAGLELHRRFWRQLVLWLANRKPEVWALAERSQYDLDRLTGGDDRVVVRAGINDPGTGGLPAQSSVTGELIRPDGRTTPLTWSAGDQGFETRPGIDRPGRYRVQVEGKIAGRSAGRAETAFVVESLDRELAEPFADLEMLKQLAARTVAIGGEYVPVEQFGSLLERIGAGSAESRVTRVQRHYLIDEHPWLWFSIFVGLLTLEWIVRRRAGLV
jgi:hypothetical protein